MLFRKDGHFKFPWCKTRVPDTRGNKQAEQVSESVKSDVGVHTWPYKDMHSTEELPEIVKNLIHDAESLTEGTHIGYFQSYEHGQTRSGKDFVKLKIAIPGIFKPAFIYVPYMSSEFPFLKALMPMLLGKRFKIKVSYKVYRDLPLMNATVVEILD